jgi:hypothetical protein
MYFQKPADALTATGGPGSSAGAPVGEVAQLNDPSRVRVTPGVPDVSPSTLPPPPPPPPQSRYLPPPPAVNVPPAAVGYNANLPAIQPDQPYPPTTSKKQQPIPSVPDEYVRVPSRERVFMVYDDSQLERAIMEQLIQDRIRDLENRIKELQRDKKDTTSTEKDLADLRAVKDPLQDPTLGYRFPPLPVVSPPGVAYQSKTPNYPPRQAILEPGYVVYRTLYFEERNAERQGWDLGPMQTLVSAAYFWRDALLLPQSVMTAWCRGPWDTSAGKCQPGSPSPYYLYPLGLTVSGTAFETLSAVGIGFAFFP